MKVALEEILEGYQSRSVVRQERGWKLFYFLPRMLLHRSRRGGFLSRDKLVARFDKFAAGQWHSLIAEGNGCAQEAATASRRRRRRSNGQDSQSRVSRALKLVQLGELSAGRQALEGAELAPGNPATLAELRRRPAVPREPVFKLPRDAPMFSLDETLFGRNIRSARRGAAGGPSGMTCDHLRPLLSNLRDLHKLYRVAEKFSQGEIPRSVIHIVKLGQ